MSRHSGMFLAEIQKIDLYVTDSMDSRLRGNDVFWSFSRTSWVIYRH